MTHLIINRWNRLGTVCSLAALLFFSTVSSVVIADVDVHPRRLVVWEALGADKEVLEVVLARIDRLGDDGHGSWIFEWESVGDYYAGKARRTEVDGDTDTARSSYLQASIYYAIAKFPDNASSEQRDAYEKHLESYLAAGKYFEDPFRVIEVPFDGAQITTYLHRPAGIDAPPLVLWANGMDTHKAEIRNLIMPLIEKGIAVATFDAPGTGESMKWAGQTSLAFYDAMFEHFADSSLVDGSRIATVGLSFAGNYASRWAAANDSLKSAVILCGVTQTPFAWNADEFAAIPSDVANTMAQAMGVPHNDWDSLAEKAKEYDVFSTGAVSDRSRVRVPVLLINGDKDILAPLSDLQLYASFADSSDLWVMGGDGHCAPTYLHAYLPRMADWIAERFE